MRSKLEGVVVNPGNKKVLLFTAFADTAEYLYCRLANWAYESLGLHSALIIGRSGSIKTTLPGITKDFHSILYSFSPVSKNREQIDAHLSEEIDILIGTDCISEGQNLQDCDYLVNYDIHWNPVRIIQRFGRIDRLGSNNTRIQMVNFWPNMELDEYIDLEVRVSGRMVLLDISATGEENVIEYTNNDQMNDLEYRRNQLEQLQNEVPNIEDLGGSISITNMTLNDFRMDLLEYRQQNKSNLQKIPWGSFALRLLGSDDLDEFQPGVIFCLQSQTRDESQDMSNPLAPYYLLYVTEDQEVQLNYTQSKNVLDLLKKNAQGVSESDSKSEALFNTLTKNGRDMTRYRSLLSKAVSAITGKAEEKGVQSLFQRGGTVLGKNTFRGIDDFEVLAYLILLPAIDR